MKNKKITDQVTFRAEEWQLKRLEEIEAMSPKDLKKSAVVRAALRYYFASKDAALPSGYGPVNPDAVPALRVVTTKPPRPVRLAKKKKGDSDAASA